MNLTVRYRQRKLDSFLYNNFITCELKGWDNGNKSALCYYEDKIINSLQILSGGASLNGMIEMKHEATPMLGRILYTNTRLSLE